MLPDEVLLTIFDFCADEYPHSKKDFEAWWQSLVHVCRRWRTVVFRSPRSLNLRLVFSLGKPRGMLDVWPALPLIIWDYECSRKSIDDVIGLLEHPLRVCQINLMWISSSRYLKKVSAAMQVPFLQLTNLVLQSYCVTMPALPDSFLGGSAPRLRKLSLNRIPFPGLPKLLLSATQLVGLYLKNIPQSGYISPEAMSAALSTLTNLESLHLIFQSPLSYPDLSIRHPPPKPFVLPVLTSLKFKGVGKYLEALVAWIDAPQLSKLNITFSDRIVFSTPQLIQFIHHTPRLMALETARVFFGDDFAKVHLSSRGSGHREVVIEILCGNFGRQLSSLEQVLILSLPPFSMLENLYIYDPYSQLDSESDWQDDNEVMPWLGLLHPFTAVKNLYLSEQIATCIAPVLQDLVGSRSTEVLPGLENIFLEGGLESSGPVQEGIGQFVAARQVTTHPIAVTRWAGHEDSDDDYDDDDDGDDDGLSDNDDVEVDVDDDDEDDDDDDEEEEDDYDDDYDDYDDDDYNNNIDHNDHNDNYTNYDYDDYDTDYDDWY